jgi:hypothetical protein
MEEEEEEDLKMAELSVEEEEGGEALAGLLLVPLDTKHYHHYHLTSL